MTLFGRIGGLIAIVLLAISPAWSQEAQPSPYDELGDLERELIEYTLERRGLIPMHEPWGQEICSIDVQTYDVVTELDPYPLWLNRLRVETRDSTVLNALTIEEGDTYTELAIIESEQSVIDPLIYAMVAIVPVQHADDGCVGVLVVTKDIWSLRGSFVPQAFDDYVELTLGLTETNLLGTNTGLSVSMRIDPLSWDIGPTIIDRHAFGGDLTLYESFRFVFDREGEGFSGTQNTFILRRELRDSTDRWGWFLEAAHDSTIRRIQAGREVALYEASVPVENNLVPERWRQSDVAISAGVTRSYGLDWKHEITPFGFLSITSAEADPRMEVDPDALAEWEGVRLPREELAMGPGLQLQTFENRYFSLTDYATFAIEERFRRGPAFLASARYSEPNIGATDRFVRLNGSSTFRWPYADDGYFRLTAGQTARFDGEWTDLRSSVGGLIASPSVLAGRLVGRINATLVSRNEDNEVYLLGVETGSRGYANGSRIGDSHFIANVEWRSAPVRILSHYWGLVTFFDAAATWDEDEALDEVLPTVGIGLRWVAPQLWSTVRSFDLGFPLAGTATIGNSRVPVPVFSFRIGQVF